jgi:hypothetical protein
MRRILHLGLGAFHRAHQAVYLQRLHDLAPTTELCRAATFAATCCKRLKRWSRSEGSTHSRRLRPMARSSTHRGELDDAYQDAAMDPVAARALFDASDPLAAFCADPALWGPLAGSPELIRAIRSADREVADFVASAGAA